MTLDLSHLSSLTKSQASEDAQARIRHAQTARWIGFARAQLAVRREEAQRIPNVTVMAGYQRNFNDNENQATYGVSVPLPLFNRNQGNIRAAQAELSDHEHTRETCLHPFRA